VGRATHRQAETGRRRDRGGAHRGLCPHVAWSAGASACGPACYCARLRRQAKAVLGLPQTNMLIERLIADKTLRRLCGWEHPGQVPSEATFSRAFAEFAEGGMPTETWIWPIFAPRPRNTRNGWPPSWSLIHQPTASSKPRSGRFATLSMRTADKSICTGRISMLKWVSRDPATIRCCLKVGTTALRTNALLTRAHSRRWRVSRSTISPKD